MNDQSEGNGGEGPRQQGPSGPEFLHLEVSRWLEGDAKRDADDLIRDILYEAVRARLEERLGARLREVGAAIADEIADDFEANLAIEAVLDTRREAHRNSVEAIQKKFREPMNAGAAKAQLKAEAPAQASGKKKKR